MERPLDHITTLALDLDVLCRGWSTHPLVTDAQRRRWPGAALRHEALGTDDPGCLRLLKEDGYDGEPVGSCTADVAVRFFSSTEHVAPPEQDLVRLGLFWHLGFFRTLHLVVKKRWEEYVLARCRPEAHSPYIECVTSLEEGTLARLLDGFRPEARSGAEELHRVFEAHGELASTLGLDRERLADLLDEMILSRVHCRGTGSPELAAFVARHEREVALLRQAERDQADAFWLKKSCWLTLQSELEDKLLLREDLRLRNSNVTTEWMAFFGSIYVELLQAQTECHRLERRIALRKADPSLSEKELDRRVSESIAEELASLEQLQLDAVHAASLAHLHALGGEFLSGEQSRQYREEARKLIREIWRLTHPDTLDGAFTERQRQKLREYLEQAVKIRRSEAQLDVRAISVLSDILDKVKDLYDLMGIDLEPMSVIRGGTLAEQTAWLEDHIQQLESQIRELMAEIQAMSLDPDVREKLASMADEETRKATLLALEQMKKELDARRADLAAEHQRMKGATAVDCR